jgi:hypothetical protein
VGRGLDEIDVGSVYADDEEGVFIVAFETRGNEGLIFQLADRIGRQDSMLGMDSYSLSTAVGGDGVRLASPMRPLTRPLSS